MDLVHKRKMLVMKVLLNYHLPVGGICFPEWFWFRHK